MKNLNLLKDRTIIVGVCGVATAYKSIDLVERMSRLGAKVRVVLDQEAEKYVTPLTFERVSGKEVVVESPDSEIDLQDISTLGTKTDLTVIAPASFSFIRKLSSGLGKGVLTNLVTNSDNPVVLAPSMSQDLYSSETVRAHLKKIKGSGFYIVEPKSWELKGASDQDLPLTTVVGRIITRVKEVLQEDQLFENHKVLVTAGPTRDLFSKPSYTGGDTDNCLGYKLSEQARRMGGEVLLVSGPTEQIPPPGVGVVWTRSVEELDETLTVELSDYDLILMASSASDWHPEFKPNIFGAEKTKKLDLDLPKAPDLARKLGRLKDDNQILVEFRTSSDNQENRVHESLLENDIDAVFSLDLPDDKEEGKDSFSGSFLFKSGDEKRVQTRTCSRLSRETLREIGARYFSKNKKSRLND